MGQARRQGSPNEGSVRRASGGAAATGHFPLGRRLATQCGRLLLLAVAGAGPASPTDATADEGERALANVQDAVVQVFSTVLAPDLYKPWTKQAPHEVKGSAVIIGGRRILTNAHLVRYASQVQVQPNHTGDKVSAHVKAFAPGIDLALLEVDDAKFFDTHPPLECTSTLPSVKDEVLALGFPTGGTSLSTTKGIVSRIEFTAYTWPVSGLRIQVDAAINPGNSGGPAVVGEKMIGLVFSRLAGDTQNIGYIVPCEEIGPFLADPMGEGKPALLDELQTLENGALRAFLKLEPSIKGVVVSHPEREGAGYPLKVWDVISKIGDTAVDDQGMIEGPNGLRLRFQYLVQRVAKDGKVPVTIWRGGKELTIQLPVATQHPLLLPDLQGTYPRYFVYGPLVFSAATQQFVEALAAGKTNWLPFLTWNSSPLTSRRADRPAFADEELVVVASPFFPHKLAQGYSNPFARVVRTVNGTAIKNLHHLVEVLRDLRDEFVIFGFAGHGGQNVVFPRKEVMAATDNILSDNGIRSQGSPDTLAVWNSNGARTSAK